jgi:galactan 5-O-arabinofuranosyltransferase
MALWADLTGTEASTALRTAQIVGTALFAPVVYLAWRMLLSAPWALAIGVTSSMVLIDPYKPYGPLVLAVLIPTLIAMLKVLRRSTSIPSRTLAGRGALFGAGLGLLFLTYSGWFVWSALGMVASAAYVFPWRTAPLRGLTFLSSAVAAFVAVSFPHLLGLLAASGSVRDDYFYFDTYVDPAYIASWKGDLPGDTSAAWPPTGELAGVGLFSVLLVVGLGAAVWLAAQRTIVIALCAFVASAWLMRFWFASQMFGTESVQLYPRTTQQLLYCSLLLVGMAVYFGLERFRLRESARPVPVPAPRRSGETAAVRQGLPIRRTAPALIGALVAVLAFGLFAGSAIADKYMPRNDGGPGKLAHVSQLVRQIDGACPAHSRDRGCADTPADALLIPDRIPAAAPGN